MTNTFPPLPDRPALSQAIADVRTGNPEAAVLRRQVERLEQERDDLRTRVTELEQQLHHALYGQWEAAP